MIGYVDNTSSMLDNTSSMLDDTWTAQLIDLISNWWMIHKQWRKCIGSMDKCYPSCLIHGVGEGGVRNPYLGRLRNFFSKFQGKNFFPTQNVLNIVILQFPCRLPSIKLRGEWGENALHCLSDITVESSRAIGPHHTIRVTVNACLLLGKHEAFNVLLI